MGLNHWYVAYIHLGSQLAVVLRIRKRSLSPICVCGEIIWENSSAPSNEIDVQCREMVAAITFVQGKQSIRGQPCARESIKFKETCRKSKFYKLFFFVGGCENDHLRDTHHVLIYCFFTLATCKMTESFNKLPNLLINRWRVENKIVRGFRSFNIVKMLLFTTTFCRSSHMMIMKMTSNWDVIGNLSG